MCSENKRNRILFFDVETTGLIPKDQTITLDKYPHILQLSFIVFYTLMKTIENVENYYIKINPEIEISEKITELTGITHEICKEKGKSIEYVLDRLYLAYNNCDTIIAHNYEFDSKMIKVELQRNKISIMKEIPYCINLFNTIYDKLHGIETYCTMRNSINICNIMRTGNNGTSFKKFPSLKELHEHLFKETPENLHDSLVDTLVCLKCYLRMRYNYETERIREIF